MRPEDKFDLWMLFILMSPMLHLILGITLAAHVNGGCS